MIYWAPFLHFYQPPTQSQSVLDKICKESYRPLLKVIKNHPKSKITVNICGVLTEMLDEHNGKDIIADFNKLAAKGQVEFVESAKYHAILPLINRSEAKRQIELNKETNSFFFKDNYKPRGFFPPEMCYSAAVGKLIKELGYDWVLLSGVACPNEWPLDIVYKTKTEASDLITFFRDDILSNKISFKSVDSLSFIFSMMELVRGKKNIKDIYVITAMDAETFGHHIKGWEKQFLAKAFDIIAKKKSHIVKLVTISELSDKFPVYDSKPPFSSSWSSTKEEINAKNYYPLWKAPGNKIHTLQWEHLNIALKLVTLASKIKNSEQSKQFYDTARANLDKAMHSCQFWWANKGRMWEINLINKGLILQEEALINAYKAITVSGCLEKTKDKSYLQVLAAREIANKIRDELFLP